MPKPIALPRLIGVAALVLLVAALVLPASALAAPGPLQLQVTPSSAAFPATTVGETTTLEIDIFNPGEDTSIEKIAIEGADAGSFNNSGNSCGFLAENQHCTLTVSFTPGSTGEKSALAEIRFSGGERAEESFELKGTGVAPHLSFSPPSYDFGFREVNSGSSEVTFTLENDGQGATQFNYAEFGPGNSNGFWFDSGNCNGRRLQPGETCQIHLYFGPNNTGSYATQLDVHAGGEVFSAEVSGEGVRPEVEASPNPAGFGSASVGSTGSTRTITLTNVGVLPTGFFIAVISGGDAGSFHLLDENCTGAELLPGASCSAHVRFAPLSAGTKAARFSVFGDGEGGMQVQLEGNGIAPAVSLTPSSLDFGAQVVGSKSDGHTFVVSNDGSAPLDLAGASIAGADLDQFVLSGDTCAGTTLAAGGQCTVKVRFAPDSAGAKSATLRVLGDAGTLTAALSGNGTAAPASASGVAFNWRGASRRGGAKLRAGSARCSGRTRCVVTLTTRLSVVRHPRAGLVETQVANLPRVRLEIAANHSRPLEVTLPPAVRALLDHGRATLQLQARWTAADLAGNSSHNASVR